MAAVWVLAAWHLLTYLRVETPFMLIGLAIVVAANWKRLNCAPADGRAATVGLPLVAPVATWNVLTDPWQ
jgi:hypothetical protein